MGDKSSNKSSINSLYSKYITIVGIAGQSMHFIQAYKIFVTKSAEDISLIAYCIAFFLLTNWLIYGLVLKARALIFAETFGLIGVVLIISGTLLYG